MIGLSLAVFQRVTAIITHIYYAPTRLKSAAVENAAPLPANVASGAINVAVPIVESSLVDRTRCRPLPIGGTTGMVVALTTIVLVFGLGPGHPPGIEVAIAPAFLSVCGLVYFIKRVQHDQHGWS